MGKRIEQAFKSLLGKSGYSRKASNEVLKWYTSPAKKSKATKKRAHTPSSDFWTLYSSMYEKGPTIKYSNPEKWQQN